MKTELKNVIEHLFLEEKITVEQYEFFALLANTINENGVIEIGDGLYFKLCDRLHNNCS